MARIILEGTDMSEIMEKVIRTNNKFQKDLLGRLENLISDRNLYYQVRKIYLDSSNGFIRFLLKTLIGDIETD